MILVLVGYRGTGKSSVGKILSQRLNMPYIGMDDEINSRAGMSIPEIVAQFGWQKFRDLESALALELSGRDGIIVDTGGGVIERPENVENLRKNACIFWLKASVDTIVSRISSCTQRPALVEGKTFTEEVAEVLERRESKYRDAANYQIDTDGRTPEELADEIIGLWNGYLAG